ncbi:hypothetical protein [Mycobacteroides salmoniphilum]|uniref:hypothetical protein n=1 Tax=Mycobacteroides salmoniphilum TaxID=404941 RepID=UPI0022773554|nr:hypothetical protein [Mycobacteroides salmoniphilum]
MYVVRTLKSFLERHSWTVDGCFRTAASTTLLLAVTLLALLVVGKIRGKAALR